MVFTRGQQVVSKATGNRGMIERIEYDDFNKCLMYEAAMVGIYLIPGTHGVHENDGCRWWFRAGDLFTLAEAAEIKAAAQTN